MNKKISIIHEPTDSEPFLVIDKPSGLPSAPLKDGDESVLTTALSLYPSLSIVVGRKTIEKGLVHRLDNDTSGLILIAATQEFYDKIQKEQASGKFVKWYKASVDNIPNTASILEGFPSENPKIQVEDGKTVILAESRFRSFGLHGTQVRPVTESSGRAALKKCGNAIYKTRIELSSDKSTALCSIVAGYRHQVRCHLAWSGFPVKSDPLYNPNCDFDSDLAFRAVKISFMGFDFQIE